MNGAWETVADDENSNSLTTRLRVPGGWLYRDVVFKYTLPGNDQTAVAVAMQFVPFAPRDE